MEKVMNSYETLFVVDATLTEEAVKATVEKFTALISENGTIDSVDEWGKRRLAYPINDKNDGYYVLVNFKSEGSFTAELERLFGINENILRSIVIRQIEDKKTRKDA
jgi:small subunit ribosomal protein S6